MFHPNVLLFVSDHSSPCKKALKELRNFRERVKWLTPPHYHYLMWGDHCEDVTLITMVDNYKKGKCETKDRLEPNAILSWISMHYPKEPVELVVVSNGKICVAEIEKAKLNLCVNLVKFTWYKFTPSQKDDLSLALVFTNKCTTSRVFYDGQVIYEFDAKKNVSSITLETFDVRFAELECMEPLHLQWLMDDIDDLDYKLQKDIRLMELDTSNFSACKTEEQVKTQFELTSFYMTAKKESTKGLGKEIHQRISHVLKSCGHQRRGLSKSRAQTWPARFPQDIDIPTSKAIPFYDAYMSKMGSKPVLLLNVVKLSDSNASFPLALLDTEESDSMLGRVYDLTWVRENHQTLFQPNSSAHVFQDPITLKATFGGIIPVSEADEWNDFIISKSFFAGKVIAEQTRVFMYYVIFQMALDCDWIESSIRSALERYAYTRLRGSSARLALSDGPLDPTNVVPLPVACLYSCKLSSDYFEGDADYEKLQGYNKVVMRHLVTITLSCGFGFEYQEYINRALKFEQQ